MAGTELVGGFQPYRSSKAASSHQIWIMIDHRTGNEVNARKSGIHVDNKVVLTEIGVSGGGNSVIQMRFARLLWPHCKSREPKLICGSSCWPSPQLLRVAVRQLCVRSVGSSLGSYGQVGARRLLNSCHWKRVVTHVCAGCHGCDSQQYQRLQLKISRTS